MRFETGVNVEFEMYLFINLSAFMQILPTEDQSRRLAMLCARDLNDQVLAITSFLRPELRLAWFYSWVKVLEQGLFTYQLKLTFQLYVLRESDREYPPQNIRVGVKIFEIESRCYSMSKI